MLLYFNVLPRKKLNIETILLHASFKFHCIIFIIKSLFLYRFLLKYGLEREVILINFYKEYPVLNGTKCDKRNGLFLVLYEQLQYF